MIEINRKNARIWSMMGSRGTFGEIVWQLAKEKPNFMVLSADLGRLSGVDKFKEQFPELYYNIGIAEQNMIDVAAGLAKEGVYSFSTSYSTFITVRACEQLRVNMGNMQLPFAIVGLGAGFEQGFMGSSHYGTEDIAVLRSIPNITIVSPADGIEVAKTICAAMDYGKPLYIRLTGSNNMPIVYTKDYDFEIGKAIELVEGEDVAIFASGTMVSQALKSAKALSEQGVSAAVINVHTIKPIDSEVIKKYAQKVKLMVTVEEHSIIGGLGTAVAEEMCNYRNNAILIRIGSPDRYERAGSYKFMLDKFGLTSEKITERIIENLNSL